MFASVSRCLHPQAITLLTDPFQICYHYILSFGQELSAFIRILSLESKQMMAFLDHLNVLHVIVVASSLSVESVVCYE